MIIYKIENKINGKAYVGQTKYTLNQRFTAHSKSKYHIGHALRKYGIKSFAISIICLAASKVLANEKERYWIKELNCKTPDGYNHTSGGEGSDARLGEHHSEMAKQKMRKPKSEIHKQNLSIAHLGKSPWNKGKKGIQQAWNKGKKGVQEPWNKGLTKEIDQRLISSDATNQKRRKPISEEARKNRLGRIPWNKGLKKSLV